MLVHKSKKRCLLFFQQRRPYQVLCAIGGWDGDSVVHSVEWYDPHTARWKPGPSMNEPRKRLGVVAHCRKVYAVGGHNGKATLSSVEVYCQRSKRWTSLPNMKQARMFSGCVARRVLREDSILATRGNAARRDVAMRHIVNLALCITTVQHACT